MEEVTCCEDGEEGEKCRLNEMNLNEMNRERRGCKRRRENGERERAALSETERYETDVVQDYCGCGFITTK